VTAARTNVSANVHGGESGGLQCSCSEQLDSVDSAECFGRGGHTVAKFLSSCCRRCSPTGLVFAASQAYPEVPHAGSAVDGMLHSGEHAVHATCSVKICAVRSRKLQQSRDIASTASKVTIATPVAGELEIFWTIICLQTTCARSRRSVLQAPFMSERSLLTATGHYGDASR